MKKLCLLLVLILALSVSAYAETTEPTGTSEEDASVETAYGEGAYHLRAEIEGCTMEFTYLDGALVYEDFISSQWGKDSYGYYNSIKNPSTMA